MEHSGHEPLLIVGAAAPVLKIVQRARKRVGPAVKMLLIVRRDRAELGFLPAGRNHKLIVIEEQRAAFAFVAALFAVAKDLIDRFWNRLFDLGRFGLDQNHGQPVQEEHDVRPNVVLSAKYTDLELAYGDIAVVLPLLEIHETNGWALFVRFTIFADACAFEQHVEDMPVVLNEIGAGKARGKLLDHLFNLIVFEPVIDNLELLAKHRQHHDLSKALTKRLRRRLLIIAIDDVPAEPLQLIKEGLLDMKPFIKLDFLRGLVGDRHKSSSASVLDLAGLSRASYPRGGLA